MPVSKARMNGSSTTNLNNQLQGIVNNDSTAKLICEADLSKLLSNPKLCNKLFPEGRVIVDSKTILI
jgi:hypothetical protein